jgi:hypothetical protein
MIGHTNRAIGIKTKTNVPKEIILFHHYPTGAMSRARAAMSMMQYISHLDAKCTSVGTIKITNIVVPKSDNGKIEIEMLTTNQLCLSKNVIEKINDMKEYQIKQFKTEKQ